MKISLLVIWTTTLLSLFFSTAAAQADDALLVRYNFSSVEHPTVPFSVAAGLEASRIGFGKTIATAFAATPPAASFSPEGNFSIRSDVLPDGVGSEGEHYLEFTLTAPAGKRLSVTGVSLTGKRSGDLPALYAYPRLKSSFDQYETVIALGQIKSTAFVELKQEINGLTVEGAVTFRLYFPAINRGSVRLIIEDISLAGSLITK